MLWPIVLLVYISIAYAVYCLPSVKTNEQRKTVSPAKNYGMFPLNSVARQLSVSCAVLRMCCLLSALHSLYESLYVDLGEVSLLLGAQFHQSFQFGIALFVVAVFASGGADVVVVTAVMCKQVYID